MTPEQLRAYMQRSSVVIDSAQLAVRVAEGWLRSATRLAAWPDPLPEDLFAWCLELSALAYANPEGLSSRTVGDDTAQYAAARKAEILEIAARRYGTGRPTFSFPAPVRWP